MTDPKSGHLFAPWLHIWWLWLTVGFSRRHGSKESTCQYRRSKTCRFNPWVGKIPWRREWQPTPVFLPGKFHGESILAGYNPWGHKELDTTEWLSTHTLLKILCMYAKSCPTLGDTMDCSPLGSSVHGIFQARNTGAGHHFLLQAIFPTQGLNLHLLCLLHWQADSLPLAPPGKPHTDYHGIISFMKTSHWKSGIS